MSKKQIEKREMNLRGWKNNTRWEEQRGGDNGWGAESKAAIGRERTSETVTEVLESSGAGSG